VAALARNRVIGRDNALPWRLSEDLKRFKALTLGHPIIMGRKTWDSIIARNGKALPGRLNIVISRSPDDLINAPGATRDVRFVATLEQALAAAEGAAEIFVIGGEQIYALALPRADRLCLTEVLADVEGDAFFPSIAADEWREASREHGAAAPGVLPHDFVVYERRADG
jgi:dihydrofolate reductase